MPDHHEDRPGPAPSDEEAALLVTAGSEWEAQLIADGLVDRGILARATGGLTAGFRAEAPGAARVIVPRSQLAAARDALAAIKSEAATIDWSKIDIGDQP